jgi:hypothetical protein
MKKFLARFSSILNLQLNKRTSENELPASLNPFRSARNDSLLVAGQEFVNGTLYFNKSDPHFGVEAGFRRSGNRSLLTSGFEERSLIEWNGALRYNAGKKNTVLLSALQSEKTFNAEYAPANNYNIQSVTVAPQWRFLPQSFFRLQLEYSFTESHDQLSDDSTSATIHQLETEIRYNKISKTQLAFSTVLASIDYSGPGSAPVQYAMLNGLQDGVNAVLNLSFQRKLSANLELSISYEGRKTGEADWVHTGRAQMRALF